MRHSIALFRAAARLPSSFALPSGHRIPSVGLGTWKASKTEVRDAVFIALEAGYRHIDTAWSYSHEEAVGEAIDASGVDRKELFVTSKLWGSFHGPHVRQGIEDSLRALKLDYLDLFLIHWPVAFQHIRAPNVQKTPRDSEGRVLFDMQLTTDFMPTWRQMERLVKEGLVRDIGVSNFTIPRLKTLLRECHVRPAVNQVECHLGLHQNEMRAFCAENDLLMEAYSPLGSTGADLRQNAVVQQLAQAHGCDPANILISWQVARGNVVLPKSITPERIMSNLALVDLPKGDVSRLEQEALNMPQRRRVDKSEEWGIDIFGS